VLTRKAEAGQIANPGGEVLFRVASGGEVEMRGQIAEQDLAQVKTGQAATVYLTGIERPFTGQVRLLGAIIDPQTRLGDIRIQLKPDPALRPGAFARAVVAVSQSQRPVLPQTAVMADARGSYVLVVNSADKIEKRPVRVSGTTDSGVIIAEGLSVHQPQLSAEEREQRVTAALDDVGLDPEIRFRYPHEFSGGQRQRIAVARAIVLEPSFVVMDEPTSALDMLIQSHIVDLLRDLQKRHDLTYLFISHDLRVVSALASRLIVMRHGKVVEEGPAADLFRHPKSDYTRALFAAAFNLDAAPESVVPDQATHQSRQEVDAANRSAQGDWGVSE